VDLPQSLDGMLVRERAWVRPACFRGRIQGLEGAYLDCFPWYNEMTDMYLFPQKLLTFIYLRLKADDHGVTSLSTLNSTCCWCVYQVSCYSRIGWICWRGTQTRSKPDRIRRPRRPVCVPTNAHLPTHFLYQASTRRIGLRKRNMHKQSY